MVRPEQISEWRRIARRCEDSAASIALQQACDVIEDLAPRELLELRWAAGAEGVAIVRARRCSKCETLRPKNVEACPICTGPAA